MRYPRRASPTEAKIPPIITRDFKLEGFFAGNADIVKNCVNAYYKIKCRLSNMNIK